MGRPKTSSTCILSMVRHPCTLSLARLQWHSRQIKEWAHLAQCTRIPTARCICNLPRDQSPIPITTSNLMKKRKKLTAIHLLNLKDLMKLPRHRQSSRERTTSSIKRDLSLLTSSWKNLSKSRMTTEITVTSMVTMATMDKKDTELRLLKSQSRNHLLSRRL